MPQKNSVDIDNLKTLCDKKGNEYIQKSGKEYISALSKLFSLNNANDNPFTVDDIKKQPLLEDFQFPGKRDYRFICKLHVTPLKISSINKRTNEKIHAIDFAGDEERFIFKNALGVSYIMTCSIDKKEHIIKIGSSRTTFEKRLGSYNCGVVNNWRTASTTNIKILQSMITTRLDFNLYLYDCSEDYYVLNWHDEQSVKFATPMALAVEDIMIKKYIDQFGKKPLANIQANATEV